VLLILCGNSLQAKNLGAYGTIYEIKEQDALEWVAQKLEQMQMSGELKKQQVIMQNKSRAKILRPTKVKNLKRTTIPRAILHDLTLVLPQDIVDAQGKLIYAKGTKINPLTYTKSKKILLFLDGDDPEQVNWALNEHQQRGDLAKLVLVNGPVIDLMQQNEVRFYFDQSGRLVHYFKIKQIPAIVEQKDNHLQISEVKI
jgi:conjugal transfer pilus assembly protein TraW